MSNLTIQYDILEMLNYVNDMIALKEKSINKFEVFYKSGECRAPQCAKYAQLVGGKLTKLSIELYAYKKLLEDIRDGKSVQA